MKTIITSSLAAAALALTLSSAFAASNSPQGAVVTGAETSATSTEQAAPRHFLSGAAQNDENFGLSSNAVQGRDFLNAQKGHY